MGQLADHRVRNAADAGSSPAAQTIGGDPGSGWSPKPASEVRFLGRLQSDRSKESAPRGAELVPKTRVTLSGQRFDSSTLLLSGDDAHVGFARLFAKQVDHGPESSTLSVSSEWGWPGERW